MKKLALWTLLVFAAAASPALAQSSGKHALGDMYTHALNAIEARGVLYTLETKKHIEITGMRADHGQVFVTFDADGEFRTMVYDMMSDRLVAPDQKSPLDVPVAE